MRVMMRPCYRWQEFQLESTAAGEKRCPQNQDTPMSEWEPPQSEASHRGQTRQKKEVSAAAVTAVGAGVAGAGAGTGAKLWGTQADTHLQQRKVLHSALLERASGSAAGQSTIIGYLSSAPLLLSALSDEAIEVSMRTETEAGDERRNIVAAGSGDTRQSEELAAKYQG
ncbi:hypothetical protein NDU88_004827 [Pleurodeles waltl]|uniref:Uncharacterized protein n=1 Tax=Pleurodeles waltl TaxID=8319 RepID=A0AAV7LJH6_PLEWA|nr:hypothetical protein NDU88_004827 [Pleurodeles waltl]